MEFFPDPIMNNIIQNLPDDSHRLRVSKKMEKKINKIFNINYTDKIISNTYLTLILVKDLPENLISNNIDFLIFKCDGKLNLISNLICRFCNFKSQKNDLQSLIEKLFLLYGRFDEKEKEKLYEHLMTNLEKSAFQKIKRLVQLSFASIKFCENILTHILFKIPSIKIVNEKIWIELIDEILFKISDDELLYYSHSEINNYLLFERMKSQSQIKMFIAYYLRSACVNYAEYIKILNILTKKIMNNF